MEGVRRSTRTRKQVQRYSLEDEDDVAASAPPPKRARTGPPKSSYTTTDVDDDGDEETEPFPEVGQPKTKKAATSQPRKASKTTSKQPILNKAGKNPKSGARYAPKEKVRKLRPGEEEYRLREYVAEATDKYLKFVERAGTDRMFVIDRERSAETKCHANHDDCPCETLRLAGSTGNVYTIKISHLPSCSCPQWIYRRGQDGPCKHILYVFHHVLKAGGDLPYQHAFLTAELRELFNKAPAMPGQLAEETAHDGNRKPVENDCPICCIEFEKGDEIVWCKAACGNNIHKGCFEQWARTRANVTCPFCRTEWMKDQPAKRTASVTKVTMPKQRQTGGYYNVRDQLEYD